MRVCFVGNFRPPASSENDWLTTLKILGHEVWPLQEDEDGAETVDMTIAKYRIDLLLFVHTNGWPEYGRTREWVKALPVPSVMLTLDLYRGLERQEDVKLPHFACRYVFTADEPAWLRHCDVNAYWSPPGILQTSAYVAAPDPLSTAYGRVIFVGSSDYHRAWPWRQKLLEWCAKEYGDDFLVFRHGSGMRGHALNVLYASAKVVVGDSCFASPESKYTSDRFFESLGRGANLVYPRIGWDYELGNNPLGMFYRAYTPGDYATLGAAIDRAMDQRTFALDASRWTASWHTYTQRLQAIFETVAQHEPSVAEALKREAKDEQ